MRCLVLLCLLGAQVLAGAAEASAPAAANSGASQQELREEKHFLECLAVVYHPAYWISYHGSLYFQPKNDAQQRQLEAMKVARSNYVAFTNRVARCALAAEALAESGVPERSQRKILLPYAEGNPNLTPTLSKPFSLLSRYEVIRMLGEGDALLSDGGTNCFVMDFGHGATDGSGTNACLIREGTKICTLTNGQKTTLEAFTSVGLSRGEMALFVQAAAGFRKQAEAIASELSRNQSRREFADSLARANDRNPFLQYQVARAYLEGIGTEKNEKLGLEWMRRAAQNGSGDAKAYLEKVK